jgi:AraC-like DNA-binding protein
VTITSFTTASGMGPLPRLLESANGARAVERVFRAEGLPLWLAHDQTGKMPLRSMMGLMERSARELGDELFGLHLGLAMRPEDYGPFVRYMASAPDLLTLIRRSIRSLRYHITGCEFDLKIFDQRARWGIRTSDPTSFGRRHLVEHVIHPMLNVMRRYLGPNWSPLRVEVEHARPECWRRLEESIGVPMVFGSDTNAIVFPATLLCRRALQQIAAKDVLTWRELRHMVRRRPPRTMVEATREIVQLRLLDATADIDGAARLLGVASRTLQRQLALENLRYRDLVQQLRMERAVELLQESVEPVTSIAFSLGYSDVASFTRAFRQWSGMAPSHYRRRAPAHE